MNASMASCMHQNKKYIKKKYLKFITLTYFVNDKKYVYNVQICFFFKKERYFFNFLMGCITESVVFI